MLRKIVLIALIACSTLEFAQGATPPNDKPVVHAADLWKYRVLDGFTNEAKFNITFRVVNVSDSEITTRMEWQGNANKGLAIFDRQWNMIDDGNVKYEPSRTWLKFPLNIGATWKQQFQSTNFKTGRAFSHFSNVTVASSEKITVPAGTFVALKLEIEGEIRSSGEDGTVTKHSIKIWYSPEVNRTVREEIQTFANGRLRDRTVTELTEYSPANPKN